MQKTPKISIVCPSFNHEKFVGRFIKSVLAQTVQDFELVIIDDCSSDGNATEIEKFADERICFVRHSFNQGINASLNDGIKCARSDIIATVASDDMLKENYIEKILDAFAGNQTVNVVYVSLKRIDEDDKLIENGLLLLSSSKSKFELIRDSFIGENQLFSPGMAFRKSAIEPFLPLPVGMFQYSDWDLHNKLLLNNEIFVSKECLVKYRTTKNSASARSDAAMSREILETDMMMDFFLTIKNVDLFKAIFIGLYERYGEPAPETIPYFLSRIVLDNSNIAGKREWGYRTLLRFVSDGENLNVLHEKYGGG